MSRSETWFWEGAETLTAPALLTPAGALSYADLTTQADALFAGLPRGLVAILCDKTATTIIAYLGALRAGQVPLLLDADLQPTPLARTISAYAPEFVVAPSAVSLDGYSPLKTIGGASVLCAETASGPAPHSDLALLLPTSGSTGDPKCVRLSHRAIDSCTRAICDYLAMAPERRTVSLLPFHYSYGLSVLNITLASRASMVITDASVLSRDLWALVEAEGITDFSGVPFMFETLRRMRFSQDVLETLRCVTQAGGRLDPKLTRHFRTLFSQARIPYFTMYGQTEAAPRISYLSPEMAEEKEGSVGIPISCGTAEIAETGAATGEGELLYRGPNVCMGYARSRADVALGDMLEGALLTGDHVSIDADGYITIVGRRARFIKVHGISVNLDHVETVLKAAGHSALVVGKENRVLVLHTPADTDRLAATMVENFTFHPSVVRYTEVVELPLTASGKPDYAGASAAHLG
ncbi:AMP-binding protein [Ruegeria arenilitoris]|uniref:AMP-binding protein n=1 Tax=Ruegeria arenilitoris TaxID=1173585 RepID=UPI001C9429CC|nr:AMP-binding protein [Ruegeria arenilitoris]MBY6081859.1 AMP-binding protein [Ruegeria arenilitoris]